MSAARPIRLVAKADGGVRTAGAVEDADRPQLDLIRTHKDELAPIIAAYGQVDVLIRPATPIPEPELPPHRSHVSQVRVGAAPVRSNGAPDDVEPAAELLSPADDLLRFAGEERFSTVLADPPWRFKNRTGKMAPEHRRLSRYSTMRLEEIMALPVSMIAADMAHLYLWVPNSFIAEGLRVMKAWGFRYISNLVWHKVRKDGGSDGRGVGFYYRNVTELVLFGVRGKKARTLDPARRQVNLIAARKREHSRKPDELYPIIEACSPGPWIELFARGTRPGWSTWGNQADDGYKPTWPTYSHHSRADSVNSVE